MLRAIVFFVTAALLPCVCLADKAVEKPVVAQTLAEFEREAASVRQGLLPDGAYSFMSDDDKQRVEKGLDEMLKLLQDHAAETELSKQDKVVLMNAEEQLNALLLQNDNNRLICERGARTGSRIKVTTCQTHGELMERERRDRQSLGDLQRKPQSQREGGG